MAKVDLLDVYSFDSGTEETCKEIVKIYLLLALKARKDASVIVSSLRRQDLSGNQRWRFSPISDDQGEHGAVQFEGR